MVPWSMRPLGCNLRGQDRQVLLHTSQDFLDNIAFDLFELCAVWQSHQLTFVNQFPVFHLSDPRNCVVFSVYLGTSKQPIIHHLIK